MTITQLPANTASMLNDKLKSSDQNWTRYLAAGSLITGAVMLVVGNRKAGIILTAVGATTALMEDASGAKEIWDNLPKFVQSSQEVLGRIERFVEEISEQGERVRNLINQHVR